MIIDYVWNYIVIANIESVSSFFCLCREKKKSEHKGKEYFWFNWTRNKITINKTYAEDVNPFRTAPLNEFLQFIFRFFSLCLKLQIKRATVSALFTMCRMCLCVLNRACMSWSLVLIIVTLRFVWHCLRTNRSKLATENAILAKLISAHSQEKKI